MSVIVDVPASFSRECRKICESGRAFCTRLFFTITVAGARVEELVSSEKFPELNERRRVIVSFSIRAATRAQGCGVNYVDSELGHKLSHRV